ncbi:hypothetical protein WA026_009276 [Henosepilachna vigintioctopunctata]|uniref:Uncharacterized protein n=1 Tax=Henosepilachna vigintioctopunctata TaxID=420089 RepID=A0AAW1UQE5_9CUCU
MPPHIKNNVKKIQDQFEYKDGATGQTIYNFANRLVHKIISLEINITLKNLAYLEGRQATLSASIRAIIPELNWLIFERKTLIRYKTLCYRVQGVNVDKLSRMGQCNSTSLKVEDSWLRNLTDVTLLRDVKTILTLGPKFCIQPEKTDISVTKLLAEWNPYLSTIQDRKVKDILTARLTNIVINFYQDSRSTSDNVQSWYTHTKLFLKEHPNLIVIQSYKRNVQ